MILGDSILMWKNNIRKQLDETLEVSLQYEEAQKSVEKAIEAKKATEEFVPSNLSSFDATHLSQYIQNIVGDEPKRGSKWNPLNHTKKKKEEVRVAFEEYERKVSKAKEQYYEEYKQQREELLSKDSFEKSQKLKEASEMFDSAVEQKNKAEQLWNGNTLLSERLKNSQTITRLIEYFDDGRVDTLKEAINLYYDDMHKEKESRLAEEHRKRLEEIILDQNESIQHAIEVAENAQSTASEALDLAQDAIDRADEAYEHASSSSYNSNSDY